MAKKPTTRQMSDAQEEHIAEVFGVRRTRGSGNQFRDQMDDRGHRMDEAVALAFDGKSTLGDSISIKKADLDKADEQAYGEAPVMAYRFYDDWTLKNFQDRYLVTENTLLELVQRSRRLSAVEEAVTRLAEGESVQAVFEEIPYDEDGGELSLVVRRLVAMLRG